MVDGRSHEMLHTSNWWNVFSAFLLQISRKPASQFSWRLACQVFQVFHEGCNRMILHLTDPSPILKSRISSNDNTHSLPDQVLETDPPAPRAITLDLLSNRSEPWERERERPSFGQGADMMIMTCHNFSFIYEHLLRLFPLKILVNSKPTNQQTPNPWGVPSPIFLAGKWCDGLMHCETIPVDQFGHLGFMDEIPMTGAWSGMITIYIDRFSINIYIYRCWGVGSWLRFVSDLVGSWFLIASIARVWQYGSIKSSNVTLWNFWELCFAESQCLGKCGSSEVRIDRPVLRA